MSQIKKIDDLMVRCQGMLPYAGIINEVIKVIREIRVELDQLYEKMNTERSIAADNFGSDPGTHEKKFE
jgi:hypothetical protein